MNSVNSLKTIPNGIVNSFKKNTSIDKKKTSIDKKKTKNV